jgi:two-component system cell cycle response regulator DivK
MTGLTTNKIPATVLVAEDHDDSRVMLKYLLEAGGYVVVEAGDGPQALELAASVRPDLILMDMNLPQLDGLSVLAQLRGQSSLEALPVIIISGQDGEHERARATAAGCTAFLTKPIDFEQLDNLLRQLGPSS